MIVRVIKAFSFNGVDYQAGNNYEFEKFHALQLIENGFADLPVNPSVLSEGAKEQYVSDAAPAPVPEPEEEDEPEEPKVMSTPRKRLRK